MNVERSDKSVCHKRKLPPERTRTRETIDPSEKKRRFIEALLKHRIHTVALAAAGLKWLEVSRYICKGPGYDEEFALLYAEVKRCNEEFRAIIRMEEADRRAVEGWDEPVFYLGKPCGVIRRYSDSLLALVLKAQDPERFGTSRHEVSGQGGTPLALAMTNCPPEPATPEEWEKQYHDMMTRPQKVSDQNVDS